MPIAVVCPCGAKLRAPDNAAGKRVKCPKCANPVAIPAPEADFEVVDDAPPPAPTPAKKKPQLLDDDDAPRPAKKPMAAAKSKPAPVEVNEAVDDDEEDETPKKKRRRDVDDDDDDTPRKKAKKGKKKAKSNLPLILGIGGGVFVLLTVIGIGVGIALSGGSGGGGTGQAQGANTQSTFPSKPAPALPSGWKRIQGEGFSVGVPDGHAEGLPPIVYSRQGAVALSWKSWAWMKPNPNPKATLRFGTTYEVNTYKLRPEFVARFQKNPDAAWKEFVDSESGGVGSGRTVNNATMVGLPGREIVDEGGAKSSKMTRLVIQGDTAYSAVVNLSSTGVTADHPEAKPFFEGFHLDGTSPSHGKVPPPTGGEWKTFRGEGFNIQVAASVDLMELKDTSGKKPDPPFIGYKQWSNVDPANLKQVETLVSITKQQLDPTFAKKFEADPTAGWAELMKNLNSGDGKTPKPTIEDVTFGGHPGKQLFITDGKVVMTIRTVIKGDAMYTVMIANQLWGPRDNPVKDCLNSFQIE